MQLLRKFPRRQRASPHQNVERVEVAHRKAERICDSKIESQCSVDHGYGQTERAAFWLLHCRAAVSIRGIREDVWRTLTDAAEYPRRKSTITAIDRQISQAHRLVLHVPGSGQTFQPIVALDEPAGTMIWSDGVLGLFGGVRTFRIQPSESHQVAFVMEELFSGLAIAILRRIMPAFYPIFDAFLPGLEQAVEN